MDTSNATKPPKIAAWRNVLYAWGKLKQYKGPGYFFLLPLAALCEVGAPLLAVALPSAVVGLYQSGQSWQRIFAAIALLAAALALANLGRAFCQEKCMYLPFLLRIDMGQEYMLREVSRDYQEAESPRGRELMKQARKAVLEGNDFGIEALLRAAATVLFQFCGLAVYLAISSQLKLWVLLVLLITTLGIALLNLQKSRWMLRHYYEEDAKIGGKLYQLSKQLMDSKYSKDVHLYRMKDWLLGTLKSVQGLRLSLEDRRFRAMFTASLGQQLLTLLRDALVYGYLIREMVQGRIDAAAFILYTGVAAGTASWLSELAAQLLEVQTNSDIVSAYRLYMDALPGRKNWSSPASGTPVPNPGLAHELRLEHVYFQYPGAEDCALEDVNLTLHPGKKLALVGPNGAGKSTLVKLLCGLYRPTKGTIYLDGVDVAALSQEAYFQEFAVVFQDVFAFAFPLAANVACQPSAAVDRERLTESLRQADLLEQIQRLPKGVETTLLRDLDKNGVELSGGQMQRLMLARALYKDAPVVLLDEPTAALDPLAEQDLYRRYGHFTQGKTSLFISHRLSSTRFCDQVVFLEHGKITERGTHKQLMDQGGGYAHMFEIQSHYYRKKEDEINA